MPCNSGMGDANIDWDARATAEKAIKMADEVTALLCKVLRGLPPEVFANMDSDVHRWFDKHLEEDARREASRR